MGIFESSWRFMTKIKAGNMARGPASLRSRHGRAIGGVAWPEACAGLMGLVMLYQLRPIARPAMKRYRKLGVYKSKRARSGSGV